jgi:hypothetical protein
LRCLDYQAPAELLAKLAGHNTMTRASWRMPPERWPISARTSAR